MTTVNASTALLHVGSGAYPAYFEQIRLDNPNCSFAESPSEESLAELGYAVVLPSPRPYGQVVNQGRPELREGAWYQTWEVREYNPEELTQVLNATKATLEFDIVRLIDKTIARGCLYTFPSGDAQHIQLRDGDRANIGALATKADRVKNAGGEKTFYFRTYENEIQAMTTDETVTMTDVAFDKYMEILQVGWALKAQVTAAATLAELPVIPEIIEV